MGSYLKHGDGDADVRRSLARASRGPFDAAAWDLFTASAPPLPAYAALADDNVLVDGWLPVRSWCARHFPLATLAPFLTNPAAVAEIAQWKVTLGVDLRRQVDPHLLADTVHAGLPLAPTPLERSWRRRRLAWFCEQTPATPPGLSVPSCSPSTMALARYFNRDSYDDDCIYDDGRASDAEGSPGDLLAASLAAQLLLLSGGGQTAWEEVACVPGDGAAAAAALAARHATSVRVAPGDVTSVVGSALARICLAGPGLGVDLLSVRAATLDVLASLGRTTLPATAPQVGAQWWHLTIGADDGRHSAFAVSDPQTGQAWAVAFGW